MLQNPAHLTYIVLSPILSTGLALLNIVTIYIFCRKFRLSSLSLIVMVNICACDVFVCLVSNTFYFANLLHPVYSWTTGAVGCKIFKFATMVTNIAQIYFFCILNTDRLRRLIYSSSNQWKKREGIIFVSAGWIAAILICSPRLYLFDEQKIQAFSSKENATLVISIACKPIGMVTTMCVLVTVGTFVIAFAVPAFYILYTLVRSQIFMLRRRKQIHFATISNAVIKMNNKLALTFNLAGALFLAVWTPFFVLSLADLSNGPSKSNENINVNFSLRCTLLIIGSAKPFIYLICLDKFRKSIACGGEIKNVPNNSCSAYNDNANVQMPETKKTTVSNTVDDTSA